MPKITIGFAVAFILIGVGAYFGFESRSLTALLFPAVYGGLLLILGLVGLNPNLRKHAMHGASVLALLGLVFLVMALAALAGGELERPNATFIQLVMGVLALILLVLYVRSFIQASRERKRAEARLGEGAEAIEHS